MGQDNRFLREKLKLPHEDAKRWVTFIYVPVIREECFFFLLFNEDTVPVYTISKQKNVLKKQMSSETRKTCQMLNKCEIYIVEVEQTQQENNSVENKDFISRTLQTYLLLINMV